MEIHKVQRLLGHKSVASTMRYLDTTDDRAMHEARLAVQAQKV
jgi:integrase